MFFSRKNIQDIQFQATDAHLNPEHEQMPRIDHVLVGLAGVMPLRSGKDQRSEITQKN